MTKSVILPQSLHSLVETGYGEESCKMELEPTISSIKELCDFFKTQHPKIYEQLFDQKGSLKRNIFFAIDEKIINRQELANIAFGPKSVIEMFFQFAGG